jgi:uncharacterized protein (TIGR03663 family)
MVQVEQRLAPHSEPPEQLALRPARTITLRWYALVFAALVIAGFLLRIYRLAERSIHHDESLHALYSWYLYVGRGYVHDPMMHGPWQFHWTALIYFLFGDSDFTARLAPVLFGTALIALPYFLRRELGRTGAVVASILLTISPVFLYFSRFAREDIYFATWNAIIVVGLFGLIRTCRERYLYLAAVGLAGGFATKEAIYISGFIFVAFFALALTVFRGRRAVAPIRAMLTTLPVSAWLRAVALTVAIDAILFTTFFTNMGDPWNCLAGKKCTPGGLWTGTIGALQYWIEQHEVQRGGQPPYYYLLLLPLYEFVPLILTVAGLLSRHFQRNLFSWFCLWWGSLALVIYSYAGEKMPWITPHITLPLLLFGAQFLGSWIERLDLGRLRQPASLGVLLLSLLVIAVSTAAVTLGAAQSLTPIERQSFLLERLSYLFVVVAAVGAILWLWQARGALLGASVATSLLISLGLFYVHTAWQVTYKNGDIPVEPLVYVQSSPDVPRVVEEIERISFQTGQGKDLRILMDNGYTETVNGQQVVHEAVSWPFEWYLRDYRQRRYYSKTIGNDINLADYPVALIMGPNVDPVRDRLSDYNTQKYRLNWWFPEDYKNWQENPAGIIQALRNPDSRARFLKFLLYREPLNTLGAREFYFYVRKSIPPLGPAATGLSPAPESPSMPVVPAAPRNATLAARPGGGAVYGRGQDGTPLLAQPKDIAVAPDGRVYVVESAASRVTVFNPDGSISATWGRPGSGDGEFQEPWGIAVAPSGEVYVADTWNHRIEKFDASGQFLKRWGDLADAKGSVDARTGSFWGPRDIALGPDGLLYVTDTGNKRIQVFDTEGNFVRAFGGEGSEPGRFREPVGLALDGQTLLVADTWNKRVQRLDLNGRPLAQYPMLEWEGQSVSNKPYLASFGDGRIVVSAPDRGLLVALSPDGQQISTVQPDGESTTGAGLPTGVAVGPDGQVYAADSKSGQVYRLTVQR